MTAKRSFLDSSPATYLYVLSVYNMAIIQQTWNVFGSLRAIKPKRVVRVDGGIIVGKVFLIKSGGELFL